jgi:hypothetical protein
MKVSSINVTEMVGRHVLNEHGAEFKVVSVRYDLERDEFIVWLADCDDEGKDSGEEEGGLTTLAGFTLL